MRSGVVKLTVFQGHERSVSYAGLLCHCSMARLGVCEVDMVPSNRQRPEEVFHPHDARFQRPSVKTTSVGQGLLY
jgi:hypothetical protein